MVSAIIVETGLTWLSICSIKSTTAASIYPGDCGNIRIPYTTSANVFDPIIIVVLYDISLEEVTLNILVLPFQSDYGDKDVCIHIRHLGQLLSE